MDSTSSASRSSTSSPALSSWPLHRWVVVLAALTLVALFPIFTGLDFLQFGPVPYFLLVIVLLGGAIVITRNRWVELALGILMAVFMALNAPFLAEDIARPDHYPGYALSIFGPFLALCALIAGIYAVTKAGRTATVMRLGSVGAVLVLIVLGFGVGTITAMSLLHAVPGTGGGAVVMTPDASYAVTTKNDLFSAPVAIKANEIARIGVANEDSGGHNFKVDELGIATDLAAGKTTDVWVKTVKTGTFQLYCSLHASKGGDGKWTGMVTTFTVS